MSFPLRDLERGEEETPFNRSNGLLVHNLSILHDYLLLDISDDKDFMAVLTKDWKLIVYTLKHTNDGIKYVGKPIPYELEQIDSTQNYYMYLSVASKTGDVAISFVELENYDTPIFTSKAPQQDCRYCLVYSKKSMLVASKKIEFQGRAVYVEDKLVLIGENILEVRYADTLKLKYFLDLNDLKKGFEALLAGETFVEQATWAKYFPTRAEENTNIMMNDGNKLILMTRHIHSNTLVTNYRGNIVRVWSIRDGSLLVSLSTKETEYVMAISGDQRFVATYEEFKKEVNVYCTKSSLLLHTYLPQEKQTDRSNFSVTYVRFYSSRPYIVIAGVIIKEPEAETANQNTSKAFYEVWSISQERLIQSMEEPEVYNNAVQPFVIEWLTENDKEEQTNSQASTIGYPPLYGVFTKQNSVGQLCFGKTLVFKYTKPPESKDPTPENQIKWGDFIFQKLGGKVYIHKALSDICEPLDGANTLGYISDHASGVYLLRFGTHMAQLWQLAKISGEEKVNAEAAGHVFNFRNVSLSSEGKYYNTIQHSQLKFARAYKGYHNDGDLSSFRDAWKSYGSSIRFMSDKRHIIVDIKKFPKSDKSTSEDQKLKTPVQRNSSWLDKIDGKIRDFFSENSKKPRQESTITEDEFFLPLPRDWSSDTDYDFCEIESAFQALHHLDYVTYSFRDRFYSKDVFETNKKYLHEKISIIINKALESPKSKRYFSTYSGSRTLALLASFENGQDLLFGIIAKKNIPVNIFSYCIFEKAKENALTILVQQHKYELFKLFYNKLLIDYYTKVPINLFPLMDVLFCLQDEDFPDLLINCVQKLSNLPALSTNILVFIRQDDMRNDGFMMPRNLIKYYGGGIISILLYRISNYLRTQPWKGVFRDKWSLSMKNMRNEMKKHAAWREKNRNHNICIAPLPSSDIFKILSYVSGVNDHVLLDLGIVNKENNSFKEDYPLIEVLISYRWRTSTRFRFYMISFIYLLHYVFYTVGVSFPEEVFNYAPGEKVDSVGHIVCIVFMVMSDAIIFRQEIVQMIISRLSYFKSFYNYIDLAVCILPCITLSQLITNGKYLYELSSITTLVLWMHFLLRLRIIRSMGNLVQLIIELGKRTFPIFVTMILVVLAFTNSFIVLLRRRDDSFFEEQYGGNSTSADENGTVGISNITTSDQSQQNLFTNVFFAFTSVWLFIYGEFDPILSGEAGNYPMAIILLVLFTFVTSLIILNVVIAVMTGAIDDTTKRGNRNWYSHFAAVVAEIEFFLGIFSKEDEPMHIYYYCRKDIIGKQKEKIMEEYERLKMKLLLNNED